MQAVTSIKIAASVPLERTQQSQTQTRGLIMEPRQSHESFRVRVGLLAGKTVHSKNVRVHTNSFVKVFVC